MKKGFTLIELLIVIGVLAILSTTVVLVLNPAELLKQTRDVQRISDLRALRSAIAFYLARNTSLTSLYYPNVGTTQECTLNNITGIPNWIASSPAGAVGSKKYSFIQGINLSNAIEPTNARSIDGTGWIPVNFTQLAENSPIPKLPLDPINDASGIGGTHGPATLAAPNDIIPNQWTAYFYVYLCQGLTYEINANMESIKYSYGGSHDVESTDGGTRASLYNDHTPPGTIDEFCLDGPPPNFIPESGGTDPDACDDQVINPGVPITIPSYIANHIYEVGNDPGLDL